MTNLLLSHADIPGLALTWDSTHAFDEDQMLGNLHKGPRFLRGKLASATTSATTLTYDLGADRTKSANHLILARADVLLASGITTVTLKAGDTDVYADATEIHSVTLSIATLYGPGSSDYLWDNTSSSVSTRTRYWFLQYSSSGASTDMEHSKAYFGTAFDFGVDPDFSWTRPPRNKGTLTMDSGARRLSRIDEPAYSFELTWSAITDANLETWIENFSSKRETDRFFLFTNDNHQILNNERILHVRINDASYTKIKNDYNQVTASFEEVFG